MSGLDRRAALAAGAGLVCAAAMPEAAAGSLDAIARTRGMRFGSAVAWCPAGADCGSFANPAYARLLERDCGLLVAENAMKWQHLSPAPGTTDFAKSDAIAAYARRNGLALRGHNLLWHRPKHLPDWVDAMNFGADPKRAAADLMTRHISAVCRHFPQVMDWDVVNEAVDPADGSLHETALSRAYGSAERLLDLAFHAARAAAPRARLVYNDYMSWEPGNEHHRAGVLRLLEGFSRRGTPVDALGVQSHIVTQGSSGAVAANSLECAWRRFLDGVTALGYELIITELDVRDTGLPVDPAIRDTEVAAYARGYLDVTLSYPEVSDLLVWGMCDRYSWIQGFDPRADGAARRPCLYDVAFRAKPLRAAIASALAAAPSRPARKSVS